MRVLSGCRPSAGGVFWIQNVENGSRPVLAPVSPVGAGMREREVRRSGSRLDAQLVRAGYSGAGGGGAVSVIDIDVVGAGDTPAMGVQHLNMMRRRADVEPEFQVVTRANAPLHEATSTARDADLHATIPCHVSTN